MPPWKNLISLTNLINLKRLYQIQWLYPQQLNWSYFKPEFTGKMDEDVEAHLLRTNDWMDMHNFPNDQKVRRFCLTLTGEARLWYETIRNANLDWPAIQEHFRQQ